MCVFFKRYHFESISISILRRQDSVKTPHTLGPIGEGDQCYVSPYCILSPEEGNKTSFRNTVPWKSRSCGEWTLTMNITFFQAFQCIVWSLSTAREDGNAHSQNGPGLVGKYRPWLMLWFRHNKFPIARSPYDQPSNSPAGRSVETKPSADRISELHLVAEIWVSWYASCCCCRFVVFWAMKEGKEFFVTRLFCKTFCKQRANALLSFVISNLISSPQDSVLYNYILI